MVLKINNAKLAIFIIISGLLLQATYALINSFGGSASCNLNTNYDKLVPFMNLEIISFIYLIFSLIVPVHSIYLVFKEKNEAFKLALSIILTHIISFCVFFSYPTCQDRSLISDPNFLLQTIWNVDNNCNNFPSLHAGIATCLMIANKNKYLNLYYLILILSCLFTKQHSILDVIAGCFIALACRLITVFLLKKLNVRII